MGSVNYHYDSILTLNRFISPGPWGTSFLMWLRRWWQSRSAAFSHDLLESPLLVVPDLLWRQFLEQSPTLVSPRAAESETDWHQKSLVLFLQFFTYLNVRC